MPRNPARRAALPLFLLVTVAPAVTSCKPRAKQPAAAAPAAAAPAPAARTYGAALTGAGEKVELGALLARADGFANRTVIVEGLVRSACTRKGCWMELAATPDKANPGCRVTFKDYGFFVPTDSAGARAKVQGVVEVSRLEPPTVRHLEEEGGVVPGKAADGSAREVRIVATGVELRRPG
jgi:hypothetical protein